MKLDGYRTLGRSGLRVSPFSLGAMTFGTERGWGSTEQDARGVFDRYVERGGNFFDTADIYTNGTSEKMLGKFVSASGGRDRAVIASKFTMSADHDNPNAGGNGRKNIYRALEGSLKRLETDYIDMYWLHAWDMVTPGEEVLATLNDLVSEGKIRYFGLSDTPAWYAARMGTLAQAHCRHGPIALQLSYSLLERNIEREHVPASAEMGWGICAWSPLQGGLLSGKYRKEERSPDWRLELQKDNPILTRSGPRLPRIIDETVRLADETGVTPAQLALRWASERPGITSLIMGARTLAQLDENLDALHISVPDSVIKQLDEISVIELVQPYTFFTPPISTVINGKKSIEGWR